MIATRVSSTLLRRLAANPRDRVFYFSTPAPSIDGDAVPVWRCQDRSAMLAVVRNLTGAPGAWVEGVGSLCLAIGLGDNRDAGAYGRRLETLAQSLRDIGFRARVSRSNGHASEVHVFDHYRPNGDTAPPGWIVLRHHLRDGVPDAWANDFHIVRRHLGRWYFMGDLARFNSAFEAMEAADAYDADAGAS